MANISIIIPVYNVEKYLPACLDSVYSQTVMPAEVILVDDGSPDKSGEICDEFAAVHPEMTQVIHQKNTGLGGARNAGIKAATGDYLFFLDSDDTVDSDAVERISAAIDETGADIVLCGMKILTPDGEVIEEYPLKYEEKTVLYPRENREILTGTPAAPLKITKRTLFTENGIEFPPGVWYEDIRTTPKLLAVAESAAALKKPLYNYYRREGSIMNNKNVERNREIIDAMEDLKGYFKNKGLYEAFREELDFLIIDHLFVSATVRVLRTEKPSHHLVGDFRKYAFENCRAIKNNTYVKTMPKNRRVICELLCRRLYLPVTVIFRYIKN